MRRFKVGQEVVCLGTNWRTEKKILWWIRKTPSVGPKPNTIVTVDGYNDDEHIFLKEFPAINNNRGAYQENLFEPVVPQEVIEELMNEISITV